MYTRARVFERTRSTTVLEVADAVAMMDAMQKIFIFERYVVERSVWKGEGGREECRERRACALIVLLKGGGEGLER